MFAHPDARFGPYTAARMDNTRVTEWGPRAYAAAIPENATPFLLPTIWAEWERMWRLVNE